MTSDDETLKLINNGNPKVIERAYMAFRSIIPKTQFVKLNKVWDYQEIG